MLGHQYFSFSTTRKYVAYMGSLLNDIVIKRFDAEGNLQAVIKVPVQYGPRDKFLTRIEGDPELYPGRPQAITLPRISFEIRDIYYDAPRKRTATQVTVAEITGDNDRMYRQYDPNPYNIVFDVSIMVKNAEDGTKIIEQIIPFFVPDFCAKLELVEETGKLYDIPVVLDQVQLQDIYKDSFETRRAITWNLTFTMKGFYFAPVIRHPLIKFMTFRYRVDDANNEPFLIHTTTPGLTANGEATSNSAETVHWSYINVNDDYGYIEQSNTGPFNA